MTLMEFVATVAKLRAAQKRSLVAPAYATPDDAAVAAVYEKGVDVALEQLLAAGHDVGRQATVEEVPPQ